MDAFYHLTSDPRDPPNAPGPCFQQKGPGFAPVCRLSSSRLCFSFHLEQFLFVFLPWTLTMLTLLKLFLERPSTWVCLVSPGGEAQVFQGLSQRLLWSPRRLLSGGPSVRMSLSCRLYQGGCMLPSL